MPLPLVTLEEVQTRMPSGLPPERWTTLPLNQDQTLLTLEELKALPALYATKDLRPDQQVGVLCFTAGNWTFHAVEFDPETGVFYGFRLGGAHGESDWLDLAADTLLNLESARGGRATVRKLEDYDGQIPAWREEAAYI